MCSIFGYVGEAMQLSQAALEEIKRRAGDRGRDGGRTEEFTLARTDVNGRNRFESRRICILGNWRAAPTTEVGKGAPLQPYHIGRGGGVVHNGTIANDRELGGKEGDVDSMVLPKVLSLYNLADFADSLERIRGSYALVAVGSGGSTVYAAVNYKPLHFVVDAYGGVYFSSMKRHLEGVLRDGIVEQLPPYVAVDLVQYALGSRSVAHVKDLYPQRPRGQKQKVLVIASAGLDSTTAAWLAKAAGNEVGMLHFTYGARAQQREHKLVVELAARLGAELHVQPLPVPAFGVSKLLDPAGKAVQGAAGAEYAHEWVPARNLVMLSLATAHAEAYGYDVIALGNNLEEAGAYPDNEEQFTIQFNDLLPYAVQNGVRIQCAAPLGGLMKHEIVARGLKVGVPYELTWSCYEGGEQHCGTCGPCTMRRIAFQRNGAVDPVMPKVP